MADNRKEQEREELHRTIWSIANDLRGSVDGWDFKQYVLGMLFYRYISENFANYINEGEREAGDATFDYAALSDADAEQARADLIETKGFFILPSQLFANVRKSAPLDENLNETLEAIFTAIEDSAKGSDSEDDFKGLFDDMDVNSNKLGGTVAERNKRLVKLMNGVGDMKLGNYQDNTIDAFGDAYEYLMGMYASNAGKSGGEYFTPQEVSELLTRIAIYGKTEINKVYDPACGSGSLLLKAAKILGRTMCARGFMARRSTSPPTTCAASICSSTTSTTISSILPTGTLLPRRSTGTTSPSRPSSAIRPTPSSGRATRTPPSSTTPGFPPPVRWRPSPRPTLPSSCTR